MPTASNQTSSEPQQAAPKNSVFGNYSPVSPQPPTPSPLSPGERAAGRGSPIESTPALALARSFIYRFLARVFEYPDPQGWDWLCSIETERALENSVRILNEKNLERISLSSLEYLIEGLRPDKYQSFLDSYIAAFGHAARGSCPMNEIEYGELKADPLFQPHRLADIAAFFRAHGLELTPDVTERHDHICLELEFMSVLAAKEAYSTQRPVTKEQTLSQSLSETESENLAHCHDTQKMFLRQHLARWTPAFFRRVLRHSGDTPLATFAELGHAFVLNECARFGITPGSDDLVLRAIDEAAESLCGSCGLHTNLPGSADDAGRVPSPGVLNSLS